MKLVKQSQTYKKLKPPRKRIQNKFFNEEWEYFPKHERNSKRSWMEWEYDCVREPLVSLNYANRWLEKQVGRHWNDVYSDICKTIPKRFRKAFLHNVEINVKNVNGQLYQADNLSYKICDGIYVDPDTGILNKFPDKPRYKKPKNSNTKNMNGKVYERINGIWFQIWIGEDENSRKRTLSKREMKKLGLK